MMMMMMMSEEPFYKNYLILYNIYTYGIHLAIYVTLRICNIYIYIKYTHWRGSVGAAQHKYDIVYIVIITCKRTLPRIFMWNGD